MLPRAQESFRFHSRLSLTVLTGIKAKDLGELLDHIRIVPESVIYQHTHRFLQQHQHLTPEPPNDFAYWVTHILNDEELINHGRAQAGPYLGLGPNDNDQSIMEMQ